MASQSRYPNRFYVRNLLSTVLLLSLFHLNAELVHYQCVLNYQANLAVNREQANRGNQSWFPCL